MATLPPAVFNPFEPIQFTELLTTLNPNYLPHILSIGCGIDSLSLLIEYIENPASRDFPLENLIVVHAVVGGESAQTRQLMEDVFFPLCRQHNIWMIQVCRNGEYEKDGITILSSTRQPTTFYLRGDYSLFVHLIMSGTVPQRGGSSRLCTLKFKGWVIDAIAQLLFGDSPRKRFIGFNADEAKRVKTEQSIHSAPYYLIGYNADETGRLKDRSYGDAQPYDYAIGFNADEAGRIKESKQRRQIFRFPLIEMGHGRKWCEQRVNDFVSRFTQGRMTQGKKSFCVNGCPFSECNGKQRERGNNTHGDLRQDWLNEPEYGGEAAFIEHMALALNDNQPLYKTQLVIDILRESENAAAIAHYELLLAGAWVSAVIPSFERLIDSAIAAQTSRRQTKKPESARLQAFIERTAAQVEHLRQGKTWAVYCVRRMFTRSPDATKKDPKPFRQTRILFQGQQDECDRFLAEVAQRYAATPVMEKLSRRFWTIQRPAGKNPPRPFVEEMLVVCPATVVQKQRIEPSEYDLKWLGITGSHPHILGIDLPHDVPPTNTRLRVSRIRASLRTR
ncbi:hypothetical protein NIES2135_61350 (plasmid) [Leptolyngbya boryana NIES-2135]|jgi:hypothetical protein|uniref:Uncharacterized protein n=1 Tax=Leptolyngbya boryana NIES-2135 TaxID=1973484 RepID=A0A1Z4JRH0_LEPBY|nr:MULTISPECIES: hypothetical protein [Leptolyngbya]BAY59258.1 hypothetical protein NIES2135_61350 [Leptolyngbya boryana NIES-2135]MBD2372847.1 hypothetical protein [Leptolyngbya sp. FACHB-238]MBD2397400.1 hypothetical protein [Leptolyngbya sp. FACHB-239]MBD2403795.1 hypothetical protein [Leptolyngbya sp. FACHB-402]ULP33451.1 hypothetical protein MCP04_30445 [Leptolyngbya boryana IU 594]